MDNIKKGDFKMTKRDLEKENARQLELNIKLKKENDNLYIKNTELQQEIADMALDIGCHLNTIDELKEKNRLLQTAAHKLINVMGE